jgi:hypothetical protein
LKLGNDPIAGAPRVLNRRRELLLGNPGTSIYSDPFAGISVAAFANVPVKKYNKFNYLRDQFGSYTAHHNLLIANDFPGLVVGGVSTTS